MTIGAQTPIIEIDNGTTGRLVADLLAIGRRGA
jgi:hypothetical protein